jgi:phosphoribosylformimino-5-aminoimidazole carboxamide ribotide isomerase
LTAAIIPVIDLLDGCVVHARSGERAGYRPLESPLCGSAEPVAVVSALMGLHPFETLYVADLGAILGRGAHARALAELGNRFPDVCFWVDSGAVHPSSADRRYRSVIGSESGINADALDALNKAGADYVLSLDFSTRGFIGDPSVRSRIGCWPRDVIVMHLPSVGTAGGPAWPVIDAIMDCRPDCRCFIAGGVRHGQDIAEATRRGVSGALVATALHSGALQMA